MNAHTSGNLHLKSKSDIHYPWPSTLLLLCALAWFYFSANHSDAIALSIPVSLVDTRWQWPVLLISCVLVLIDLYWFLKTRDRYDARLQKYRQQIDELFRTKQQLQSRAQTVSGHADKLKLFISERLLEYIEYDEKFLHFKNIAAEVRHNGVISFDKVQTALKYALADDSNARYSEALESMNYLWDLLDLSTTDNIAVHIANKLYTCEEHYFQKQFGEEESQPVAATYAPEHAIESALLPLLNNNDDGVTVEHIPLDSVYTDNLFRISLNATEHLLGNKNYLVLLMENLVSNALFYSGKARFRNSLARVAISLRQEQQNIRINVYNHGPHVDEINSDKIFQLGFSTRQIRDHHGKGLGLHFVNQIVQGYEGNIRFDNIPNRADTLSIRVSLANGEIETHVVEVVLEDERARCRLAQSDDVPGKKIDWTFADTIDEIEVSSQIDGTVTRLQTDRAEFVELADGENWAIPRWTINVQQSKRKSKLAFQPLDVTGVQFTVTLPTARSRLEFDESDDFFEHADE